MGVIVCGVFPEADGKVTCPCCKETRVKGEEDMSNACFWCAFGDNLACERCLKEGIVFTVFKAEQPVAHVIHDPSPDGVYTALCGDVKVTTSEMTGWMAPGTNFCAVCCPDVGLCAASSMTTPDEACPNSIDYRSKDLCTDHYEREHQ